MGSGEVAGVDCFLMKTGNTGLQHFPDGGEWSMG